MVLGLMVPPANGSFCRGSENQPAGRRPVISVRIFVVRSRRAFSSSRRERAHVLVLEAVRRDLVPARDERLDPGRIDLGGDGRHGERRLEPMLVEHRQHEIEPLVRPERGRRASDVARRDALGSAGDAQVDDDVDRAALARRASGHRRPPGSSHPRSCSASFQGMAQLPRCRHAALRFGGCLSRQWRATSSQVANHTPGSVFMRAISRSSMAMRSARPDTNGCRQTLR